MLRWLRRLRRDDWIAVAGFALIGAVASARSPWLTLLVTVLVIVGVQLRRRRCRPR